MPLASAARQQSLLSPPDVSALIGIPEKTLANWRSQGKGPKYLKVGRHVRYRLPDLNAWLDAQGAGAV